MTFLDRSKPLFCSFCGKSQHDALVLIAGPPAFDTRGGPNLYICDWCVNLCVGVVHEYSKPEQRFAEFQSLIDQITYKPGWYFVTGIEQGRMWVQVGVTVDAEISFDVVTKQRVPWKGAKHFLSEHMCRNEIVSTCYHAIERAELHEAREWFRYKKRSIFNPHLDPDALVEVASKAKNFNTRENAMTMEDPK